MQWVRKPTPDVVRAAFPKAAIAAGETGRVVLSCSALADGRLEACSIVSETPEGLGFGAAALGLTRYFKMKVPEDLTVLAGSQVRIPIQFPAPPMRYDEILICNNALSTGERGRSEDRMIMGFRDRPRALLDIRGKEAGLGSRDIRASIAESRKTPLGDQPFPKRCWDLMLEE